MKSSKQKKALIALNVDLIGNDAKANLALLEQTARKCTAFGADLKFDDLNWKIKGRTGDSRNCTLWFTINSAGDGARNVAKRPRLREPFATFLKSIIRLMQAAKHREAHSHMRVLAAGRYLHDELAQRNFDPAELTAADFHRAEAAVSAFSGQHTTRNYGLGLLAIAAVVQQYCLSKAPIDYRPSVKQTLGDYRRLDVEKDPDMLPSAAAMAALPLIAQKLTDPSEICMMRVIELLHCAPWRIGELCSLPLDCEVVTSLDGKLLTVADLESGVPVRYGLRYKPEKSPGAAPDVKWMPSAAIPLVRRALKDLRESSSTAREAAAFMEDNPGRAWLPAQFRNRDRLTLSEIAEILQCGKRYVPAWLQFNKVSFDSEHVSRNELERLLNCSSNIGKGCIERIRRFLMLHPGRSRFDIDEITTGVRLLKGMDILFHAASVSRVEFEAKLLSMNHDISPDFPWKLSECLFVFPKRFFARGRSTLQVVNLLNSEQLHFFLNGNAKSPSIFERHGYTEENGDPIRVTSHQFRRWLATLAMDHEMSTAEVQNWLGHTHDGWIEAYDYRTPDKLGQEARAALSQGFGIGPMADIARSINSPKDRDTFLDAVLATAHITEYGMCARDWLSQPCVRYGACVACEKQLIKKGDAGHRKAIARNLNENRILLDRANAGAEDGQIDAGNHAQHLLREVAALEATLAVHDDLSIADGTYVQLDLPSLLTKPGEVNS